MKRSKRLIAMFMVLSLCLTMIPMQVFAGSDTTIKPANDTTGTDPGDTDGGDEGNNGGNTEEPGGGDGGQETKGPYKVTLDPKNGSGKVSTYPNLDHGSSLDLSKEKPTYEGYTFKHWTDGTTVYQGTIEITSDLSLYAVWDKDSASTGEKVTITFNPQSGTLKDSEKKITLEKGETLDKLPTPTRSGYTFQGWYLEKDGEGGKLNTNTKITKDVTYYAYWKSGSDYTITFDPQKGTCSTNELSVAKNGTMGKNYPTAKRTNFEFIGWYTAKDGYGQEYTKDTKITKNVTLYASYFDTDLIKVTFNYKGADGGEMIACVGVNKKNETLKDNSISLPKPKKDGYEFDGWYTKEDGKGEEFTEKTKVTGKITVYANWIVKDGYTVKFDYEGATGGDNESKRVVAKSDKIGSLPSPTKTGYTFKGWYTKEDGQGDQYSSSTKVTKNITLYAYFVKSGTAVNPNNNNNTNTNTNNQGGKFRDVKENDWFYKPVEFVINKKLFSGMGEDEFAPQVPMTRAMFVTVLGKMAESMGYTTTGYSNGFSDVGDSWYTQYVAWAAANDIVGGYSEWQFAPDEGVTREQMASLFVRFSKFANLELGAGDMPGFGDSGQISDWARDDVNKVVGAGLMQGSDGNFNPKGSASRAEVATVFMNLSEKYIK